MVFAFLLLLALVLGIPAYVIYYLLPIFARDNLSWLLLGWGLTGALVTVLLVGIAGDESKRLHAAAFFSILSLGGVLTALGLVLFGFEGGRVLAFLAVVNAVILLALYATLWSLCMLVRYDILGLPPQGKGAPARKFFQH